MPFDSPDWHEWRGATDEKMKTHSERLDDHCERLDGVEKEVASVLTKLAVPLFLIGIAGPVVGGILVAILSKKLL